MPCLLGLFALLFPRVILAVVWLFSDYLSTAYQTVLWPLLGFIFLPLTTLAYAWAVNSNGGSVNTIGIVVIVIAVAIDLSLVGGGGKASQAKRR
ncbi:MAG: hypothetical protein MK085_10530 [Phycisphaerales bacterium]|nr:hypothetical protein [Phycisphaerales bacterium]